MASAAHAISHISEVTNILRATVGRTGRVLREANLRPNAKLLWPYGEKGQGQEAHVEPYHLINLMLALTAASPITDSPNEVSKFRRLVPSVVHVTQRKPAIDNWRQTRVSVRNSERSMLASLLHSYGNTLGGHLDGLVQVIQNPINIELRSMLKMTGFSLCLTLGEVPSACINIGPLLDESDDYIQSEEYQSPQENLFIVTKTLNENSIKRSVDISFAVFEVMADLWADTLAFRKKKAAKLNTVRTH